MEIEVLDDKLIVTKTDIKGKITYANPYFIELAGYKEKELLNKPHNIIRHEDVPKAIFRLLWKKIMSGKEINAFIKNKVKKGDYYWVKANVTPSYKNNQIVGYFSVRRKANAESVKLIEKLYSEMRKIEAKGGNASIDESLKYLKNFIENQGVTYEEFISEL